MAEEILSPKLRALNKMLEAGDHGQLDTFWKQIKKEGTPLWEQIEGDDEHMYVTFLHLAEEAQDNVLVFSLVLGYGNFERNKLTRMPYTRLWYKTVKVRRDILTTYQIAINDSLEPLAFDAARMKAWMPDPLNPNEYLFPKDEDDETDFEQRASVLAGPDAPKQPHIDVREGVSAGKLEKTTFKSKILGNERSIFVYTPPKYKAKGDPYHLLVTFDGFAYTTLVPTHTILDNLLDEKKIPPMVAVMINNVPGRRAYDLPPNEDFPKFLREELIPWVHENYHVTADPTKTFIAGASYGGLGSAWNAFKNPDIFGNVLSQSGSYWWSPSAHPQATSKADDEAGWLIRQYVEAEKLPINFYMDIGLLEGIDLWNVGNSHQSLNRHMRDVLRAKGYKLHYREYSGGHDFIWWRQTLADGLIALVEMATTK